METLQATIDRIGPPPREVCLDWAWQIRDFVNELDHPLTFHQIVLAERGRLSLQDLSPSSKDDKNSAGVNRESSTTARKLIVQLLEWAGEVETEVWLSNDSSQNEHAERQLLQYTESTLAAKAVSKPTKQLPGKQITAGFVNESEQLRARAKHRQVSRRTRSPRARLVIIISTLAASLLLIAGIVVSNSGTRREVGQEDLATTITQESKFSPSVDQPQSLDNPNSADEPAQLFMVDDPLSASETSETSAATPAELLANSVMPEIASHSELLTESSSNSSDTQTEDLSAPVYLPGSDVPQPKGSQDPAAN